MVAEKEVAPKELPEVVVDLELGEAQKEAPKEEMAVVAQDSEMTPTSCFLDAIFDGDHRAEEGEYKEGDKKEKKKPMCQLPCWAKCIVALPVYSISLAFILVGLLISCLGLILLPVKLCCPFGPAITLMMCVVSIAKKLTECIVEKLVYGVFGLPDIFKPIRCIIGMLPI